MVLPNGESRMCDAYEKRVMDLIENPEGDSNKKRFSQTIKPNERSFDVSLSGWSPASFGAVAAAQGSVQAWSV